MVIAEEIDRSHLSNNFLSRDPHQVDLIRVVQHPGVYSWGRYYK